MAKFLIVDDDPAGRRLLHYFLSPLAHCDHAFDGNEAVETFRTALEQGEPYDLVCLDIMMPGSTGHEALRAIRRIEADHNIFGSAATKIIMVTALNDPKHCIRAFGEGCEGYVTKPVDRAHLLSEIESLLGELKPEDSPPKRTAAARPGRFLIVDDDRLCRELLKDTLATLGICDLAYNGEEAVEAIRLALEENDPYDLVCLDIMMPGSDGHQALEAIREVELEHGIYGSDGVKVIMTTALRESGHCVRAFNEGCEAYLTKPVGPAQLLAQMRSLGVRGVDPAAS